MRAFRLAAMAVGAAALLAGGVSQATEARMGKAPPIPQCAAEQEFEGALLLVPEGPPMERFLKGDATGLDAQQDVEVGKVVAIVPLLAHPPADANGEVVLYCAARLVEPSGATHPLGGDGAPFKCVEGRHPEAAIGLIPARVPIGFSTDAGDAKGVWRVDVAILDAKREPLLRLSQKFNVR